MASNLLPASSSTLQYRRDESSTAQVHPTVLHPSLPSDPNLAALRPTVNGASSSRGHSRTHSLAQSYARSDDDSDDDDDDDEDGYGRRAGEGSVGEGEGEEGRQPWEGGQYWVNKRHLASGNPRDPDEDERNAPPWRLRSRLKTFSAALTLCLNLGVDPPDVVKTQPCAKLECWVDPGPLPPTKALEGIGRNLQQQFETLSPKVRYKQYLDPSVEETKKFCVNLRKQAKDERVLMYYNGHGVPKPTASGEIWVFNKNYTQYIPVSLYDLQSWLGSPCIFVWDCSAAGNILTNFNRWAERRDADHASGATAAAGTSTPTTDGTTPNPASYTPFMDCIHLAACQADQVLPMTPELPADLFTCCLTSPIEIALRFFVLQDPLRHNVDPNDPKAKVTVDLVMKIPGDLKDRRTPLGELNWIFTAVTDTIAWLVFPRDIFKRLFRQDLLVAALFRNFLLAERIMRAYHCTPMSHPVLPATHNHPLWNSWDLAVDACLNQLPALLEAEQKALENPQAPPTYIYQPSRFFAEHLQAFEIWLQHGGIVTSSLTPKPSIPGAGTVSRQPPDQLPIVLQVLLSQAHRLRALILLSKFVDLGPWAVQLALSIGIFPYVQKLLQSPAVDLKPVLIFIWSRILAVDRSCQVDLLKDNGFGYFARVLAPPSPQTPPLLIPNASEHRAMCAFILSMVSRGFRQGQMACMGLDVFRSCFSRLQEEDWLLKQWSALCIAQMWADGYDEAKMIAIKEGYQDQLLFMLKDESAEVRAAAMYAIGTLLGASGMPAGSGPGGAEPKGGGGTGALLTMTERGQLKLEAGVAQACVLQAKEDASPLVRKELVIVLSCVAREWRGWFVAAAWTYHEQEEQRLRKDQDNMRDSGYVDGDDLVARAMREWAEYTAGEERPPEEHRDNMTILFIFKLMYTVLLDLSVDPHPEVASLACTVVDYLTALLLDSAFNRAKGTSLKVRKYEERTRRRHVPIPNPEAAQSPILAQNGFAPAADQAQPSPSRSEVGSSAASRITSTLKRNSSIATALKSLATMTGYSTPADDGQMSPAEEPKPKLVRQMTNPHLHVQPYVPPYPMSRNDTSSSLASLKSSTGERSARNSSLNLLQSQMKPELGFTGLHNSGDHTPRQGSFSASAVIQALTEEDMERLRIRRNAKTEAGGGADGKSANAGMPQPHELGLGMVAKDVKDDVLPLRSEFYDYSLEYFKEPQMKIPDTDEPGSVKYNEQTWRQQRNQEMIEFSRSEDRHAAHSPWTKSLGNLQNDTWASKVLFHSFEPHLAVTDEMNNICIWDWKSRQRLTRFNNGNSRGSSVTSMNFINETAGSLLLTASSDGNVRLFRDYDQAEGHLTSAFRGFADRYPVTRKSGVVTSWDQGTGHLLVGGDSKYIRFWDAKIESLVWDIPTQAGSNVTALGTESESGQIFVAGFGDGVVRVFDKRMEPDKAIVSVLRQHHTWIQSVHMQAGGAKELVTGSMNGDIKIWDIRTSDIPLTTTNVAANGLSALAVHDHAPIFATTSAPYASSSLAYSQTSGGSPAASRRGQRLSVYRMEQDREAPSEEELRGRRRSSLLAANGGVLNGTGRATLDAADIEGPQPVILSSTLLRGDSGPGAAGPASSVIDGHVAELGRQGGQKPRFGAGMNALAFHPNELVLAVGGFDRSQGGVQILTYDSAKGSRRAGAASVFDRQWE